MTEFDKLVEVFSLLGVDILSLKKEDGVYSFNSWESDDNPFSTDKFHVGGYYGVDFYLKVDTDGSISKLRFRSDP